MKTWTRRAIAATVLALAAMTTGCELGSSALNAQQNAANDPEVVMRRVMDLNELASESGSLDGAIPLPGGRSALFTSWTSDAAGFGNLAILDLETRAVRQLTADSSEARYSIATAVSADGRWIGFWKDSGAPDFNYDVRVIGTDGRGERSLLRMCCQEDLPINWAEARSFSPDSRALLVDVWMQDGTRQLRRISLSDGSTETVRAFDWRAPVQVAYSPDGRWIAYDFQPDEDKQPRDLYVLDSDGKRETRLTHDGRVQQLLGWAADGSGLYYLAVSTERVWSVWRLPVREGRATGDATLVRGDLQHVMPGYLDISDAGIFLTVKTPILSLSIVPIDLQAGRLLGSPTAQRAQREDGDGPGPQMMWSPDSRSVLYTRRPGPALGMELVVHNPASGEETTIPLPLERARMQSRIDERTVMVGGFLRGRSAMLLVDLPTARVREIEDPKLDRAMEALDGPQSSWNRPRISADGSVSYQTRYQGIIGEIVALRVETGEERVLYRGKLIAQPFISPDRRSLAFLAQDASNPSAWELRVVPTEGGEAKVVFTSTEGVIGSGSVDWAPDNRTLIFLQQISSDNEDRTRLWRVDSDGKNAVVVFEGKKFDQTRLSPDGSKLAFRAQAAGTPVNELWILENLPEQRTTPRPPR